MPSLTMTEVVFPGCVPLLIVMIRLLSACELCGSLLCLLYLYIYCVGQGCCARLDFKNTNKKRNH